MSPEEDTVALALDPAGDRHAAVSAEGLGTGDAALTHAFHMCKAIRFSRKWGL